MSLRVTGLDGRSYAWDLSDCVPSPEKVVSAPHRLCRRLLGELHPLERVLEEVFLPGSGGLRADFVLPRLKLVVEVMGRQHRTFSSFHHRTRLGFLQSLARDAAKREWVEKNGLRYVALDDDDSGRWRSQLSGAGETGSN